MFTRRLHVSLKYCSCQQLADHVINEKDNRMLKLFEHNNRNFICISSEHVCLLPSAYNVPGNIHDLQLRCVRLVICKSFLRRSILLISQKTQFYGWQAKERFFKRNTTSKQPAEKRETKAKRRGIIFPSKYSNLKTSWIRRILRF